MPVSSTAVPDPAALWARIQILAQALGFAAAGVAGIDLSSAEGELLAWIEAGYHGTMDYMARHGVRRARPAELVPGTVRVLSFRMDYLPQNARPDWIAASWARLEASEQASISWYARGRDYHKVVRSRLEQLAARITAEIGPFGYRVFSDSAPVLEVELAARAGLGWRGKHTLALSRTGSMFFLGELFVDFALPLSAPHSAHCGRCTRCIDVCPTQAIVAPFKLDARRCISYLTIEHAGAIPVEFRRAMGNRIYGCDDCQLVCPWNKFATRTPLADFASRQLEEHTLLALFAWDEEEFLRQTAGTPIRRIGHQRWLRNLAVALGNALARLAEGPTRSAIEAALRTRLGRVDTLVGEHIQWALAQAPGPSA